MRKRLLFRIPAVAGSLLALCATAAFWLLTNSGFAQVSGRTKNLIENGTFDDPANPLKGWITDYEWTKNKYDQPNKDHVIVVDKEGDHKKVVFLKAENAKMETVPMPFEPGFRYRCKLDVKKGEYPMRIYFAGYKWKPGIRPHEKPEIWELRKIYESNSPEAVKGAWCKAETQLPGPKLSDAAKNMLKDVRFFTLYIWTGSPAYVDNVLIEKVPDPSVKFE
jgi:hypothetical protein